MATLTPQTPAVTGSTLTLAAAAGGGDSFPLVGVTLLLVRNADASSKTVTLVRPGTTYGQADPDVAFTVVAGATAVWGPIPADWVDQSLSPPVVGILYSAVTSVTVAVIRVL